MPTALINRVADVCGIPLEKMEGFWDLARNSAKERGKHENDQDFWSYVVGTMKKMVGDECRKKLGWTLKQMPSSSQEENLSRAHTLLVTTLLHETMPTLFSKGFLQ